MNPDELVRKVLELSGLGETGASRKETEDKITAGLATALTMQMAYFSFCASLYQCLRNVPGLPEEYVKTAYDNVGTGLVENWVGQIQDLSAKAIQDALDRVPPGDSIVDKVRREELERRKETLARTEKLLREDFKRLSDGFFQMLKDLNTGPSSDKRTAPC